MEENEKKLREDLALLYKKFKLEKELEEELFDACCDLLTLSKEEIIIGFENVIIDMQVDQAKILNKYESSFFSGMRAGSLLMTVIFVLLTIFTKIF